MKFISKLLSPILSATNNEFTPPQKKSCFQDLAKSPDVWEWWENIS